MDNAVGYGVGALVSKAAAVMLALCGVAHAQDAELVALGDSLTQGYGLPAEDGFVPQLQQWLRENGHGVEVVNAGVSGDTTAGGLSRVEWSLSADTDAMIVALGGNDLLRGLDPAVSRENLAGILEVAAERDIPVLLAGLPAPGNYGTSYKQAFDSMYPDLAEAYGVALYPNFLGALGAESFDAGEMGRYMQSDGIHPNADGVARIVNDIGPHVADLLTEARTGTGEAAGSN